jgi:uncharacterized protein (UPF0332 family)
MNICKKQQKPAVRAAIDLSVHGAHGWYITVTFYAALHHIQAYLVNRGNSRNTHHSRASAIQKDPLIKNLYSEYRNLEDLSREARYDATSFKNGDVENADSSLQIVARAIKALI